jgi:hypothetical protein
MSDIIPVNGGSLPPELQAALARAVSSGQSVDVRARKTSVLQPDGSVVEETEVYLWINYDASRGRSSLETLQQTRDRLVKLQQSLRGNATR